MKRIWIALPVLALAVAASALIFTLTRTSAVQAPEISLDMDPAGNAYDENTNSMTVGTIENCLATDPANAATHTHPAHLIIENVEDLVAFQVRLNYIGDQLRPNVWNPTPFTDNLTAQSVGFINLPLDSTSLTHRSVTPAAAIPVAPADGSQTSQTALVGASYVGTQDAAVSPDTPAKATPDDTSYSATTGGVLGTLVLQVLGDETGQASLFMDLDDGTPNSPGSRAVVFTGTGTGTADIDLAESALFDGFHAEGAASCAIVDVRDQTFRNLTNQTASGLHIQFSGPVDQVEVVSNAPGCGANTPTISGDLATGVVDLTWPSACVADGEEVVLRITSGGATRVCSDWIANGLAVGAADGDAPCTQPTGTPTPTAPTPTATRRGGTGGTGTPGAGAGAGGASPSALPPTGAGDDGWSTLSYALLFVTLAIPVAGAAYGVRRLRRR